MGLPGLIGLLQNPEVNADDVTVICGSKTHNNVEATAALLRGKSIEISPKNLISYRDFEVTNIALPHIIVLGIKPFQLHDIAVQYAPIVTQDTVILTMLSGVPISTYKSSFGLPLKVARIMPHVPLASYGLYSDDATASQVAKLVFTGMGEPAELSSENQMHPFTAVAASAPAFIAHFYGSFDEVSRKDVLNALKQIAQSEKPTIAEPKIVERCEEFHRNYVAAAQYFLGNEAGIEVTNKTLLATATDLQKTALTPDEYIASVRSKKGTTNAGLLFMGNGCPQNKDWGTVKQLEAQKTLASKYQQLAPEDSIKHAIVATTGRSVGSGINAANPMEGIVETDILTIVAAINARLA